MKAYIYYHPEGPKNSDQLAAVDLEILPHVGHAIRYTNLDDHYEDGIVKEIRWDVTDEGSPHVVLLVAPNA
jgi:hypothetical protein